MSAPLDAIPADLLEPTTAPREGMGVVFDAGHPDRPEQGGPIFGVEPLGPRRWTLRFGDPGPDLARVPLGARVWISGDPALARIADRAEPPLGRLPLSLTISGSEGEPLRVHARAGSITASIASEANLACARGGGLDPALLRDKLAALGNTPFHLSSLDTTNLAGGLHLPVSQLKAMRRQLVADLTRLIERGPAHTVSGDSPASIIERVRGSLPEVMPQEGPPLLVPLCRTDEQLEAIIESGVPEVELDWMEMVGLSRAVERARAAGLRVVIATLRVQKPGEEGYDARIARLDPDAVLVRHLGAVTHFRERQGDGQAPFRPILHGDFSLNATNSLTARHLLGCGLDTVTCAHDLDATQVFALLSEVPAGRIAVTIHHHIPTFHTEHCVYAHLLSTGRDYRSCGRPCEQHRISLRDRVGLVHPVLVDVGCRNTVFNAQAQSAASLVPRLLSRGVRRLRIELVRETRAETARVLAAYRDLIAGRASAADTLSAIGTHEQFGVTRGTMQVLA